MKSPSPEQVRGLRERHGLAQSLLADLVHATLRSVQNWEAPLGSRGHRDMPPGLFELALIKLGESPQSHGYVPPPPLNTPQAAQDAPRARRRRMRGPSVLKKETPPVAPPKRERAGPERLAALRALAQRVT